MRYLVALLCPLVLLGQGTLGYQTYKPSATGGIVRSADQHYADAPSVKDFGAKGTGGPWDDTTAFQNALNAQAAGGSLYVPPGTYSVTSLTITKPVTLNCAGASATLIQGISAVWTMVSINSTHDVTIRGCHIDASIGGAAAAALTPPQGPPLGVTINNSTDIRFEDNLFTHTNEALDFFNITRAWIDRNRIDTTLSSGIRFDAPVSPPPPATQVPANNHYVWLRENWLTNVNTSQAAGHGGIFVDANNYGALGQNTYFTMEGNHIETQHVGINGPGEHSSATHNTIIGNATSGECIAGGGYYTIYRDNDLMTCGGAGILLWSWPGTNGEITVEGNTVTGAAQGVAIVWGAQGSTFNGISISGNRFMGMSYGIQSYFGWDPLLGAVVTAGTWSRVFITGNDLSGNTYPLAIGVGGGGALAWGNITATTPAMGTGGWPGSLSGAVLFEDLGTGLTASNPNWLFVNAITGKVGIGIYPGWPPNPLARLHVQGDIRGDWAGPSSASPNLLLNSVYSGGYLAPVYIGMQSSGTPLGEVAADTGSWFRFHAQHETSSGARNQFAVLETHDDRRFGLGPWGASFYNASTDYAHLNAPVSPMADAGAGLQAMPTTAYCSDCASVGNVCAAGGTGQWAFYAPITSENWLVYSQQFHVMSGGSPIVWLTHGTGSATDNQTTAPDGTNTAATITINTGYNDVYQDGWYGGLPTPLPAGPYTPSIWIKPISTAGVIGLLNPNGSGNGLVTVDLAALPPGIWTRIAPGLPAATVVSPFVAVGNRSDGLDLGLYSGTGPVSFFAWGAQINEGTAALGYVATTTAQKFQPGGAQGTWYCPAAPPTVASVFGRTGAVVAATGDYTAAQVTSAVDSTQTYSNPAWITALGWAKLTGLPSLANTVFGRSGTVVAATGDYTAAQVTNAVDSTQTYSNPAWLTGLAWSKIQSPPAIGTPPVQGTRASRASTTASPDGLLYRETDTGLTYMALSNHWIYESGTWAVTQSQVAGLGLGQYDSGLTLNVTDYSHRLLYTWSGSSGSLGWAPGDPESGWVQTFAVAPSGAWWALVNGSAITYLKSDGTTGSVTPGSMTGGVYEKFGSAFTGTVNAASSVGGTIGSEAAHTHSVAVAAGTTGAPSATQQIPIGSGNAGGQNYLANSEAINNWTIGTGASVTADSVVAPDGNTTAEAVTIGVSPAAVYEARATVIPTGTFMPSFWIQRVSASGLVTVLNLRTQSNGTGGWWDLDLSYLPASGWTRITSTSPGVTVHYPFTSTGASNDGFYLRALSTVSFNLWGAQINTGTLAAPYQATTTMAVISPENITLSFPDPAHTHTTALQNITSGAGTSHTHTFTGAPTGDPANEVFLPYFRR